MKIECTYCGDVPEKPINYVVEDLQDQGWVSLGNDDWACPGCAEGILEDEAE